jgi:hypothetical protein
MALFLLNGFSLENRLIGNILREYPQMSGIMQIHFGGHCLQRPSFKIQTLGMACILFDVDKNRLIQDFEKVRSEDEDG